MNFAIIRSATRNCPPGLLPPTNYLRSPSALARKPCEVRLRQLCSGSSTHPESQQESEHSDSDMDKREEEDPKVKDRDAMSHSFGDGYSTRSDEEGFGGIYGGNQPGVIKDDNEIHDDHPEYDKTQGSEVKEKEKARHQT